MAVPTVRAAVSRFGRCGDQHERVHPDSRQRAAPSLAGKPSLVARPGGRTDGRALSPTQVTDRAKAEPLRIVYVGNVVPRKDPETLVAAVARGRPERDWELTVVGSHESTPDYADSVVRAAEQRGVEDCVEFTGEVDTDALEGVLERSHVCCVPSRYEAFGMVYLEAMEYGVVPIASSVGGASEFVEHEHNGFVVDPGHDAGIAAILTALDDDRERQHASAKALSSRRNSIQRGTRRWPRYGRSSSRSQTVSSTSSWWAT
ncbi:glycosyltransferase [Natronoarchaeum sp. GCM10025703]|uniref:glycosyltransferase n=1 Tax=Natronoarchaeum sp. GCM10025703 TaxID=3252685 RepID=UPI00361D1EB3